MFRFKMLLLWCCLIAASYINESRCYKDSQEVEKNGVGIHRTMMKPKSKNNDDVSEDRDGETPHTVSNDEIWFDSNDGEEEDYEILDVEEEEDLSNPSFERNYESLLNYIKQAQSIEKRNNNDNHENSYYELSTSDDFAENEVDRVSSGTGGHDFDESIRFKKDIDAKDLFENLDNSSHIGNHLHMRGGTDENTYRREGLQPIPYTSVYDYEYATPETEIGEERWRTTPCLTNLQELYTCIFCSSDALVRKMFLSCYELLPKRVKEEGIKCFSKVLRMPFGEGSDGMDYYHYLCKKFKSIKKIIKCTSDSLPELPKQKFLEEERELAKYSYCLYAINSRHCC